MSVDQDPEADLVLGVVEVLRYSSLKGAVRFLLEDAERWKL